MEIKPGYKQTEIGVIPDDWEVDYIGNQLSINTGKRNTQDSNVTGEYPFFVRSQVVERINSYSFDGEAVLTAGDGVGTGKVVHYINGRFDYHQRVYCLSGFSQKLDGYYFYLFFKNRFLARIQQFTAKTSVDSVRLEMISKMPVALPPLSEQKHIAVVMQDIDSLITSLEKLIEKKKLIKQGVLQELLTGKRRLPGFSGEWETKRLGDIAEIYSGGTPSTSIAQYWDGDINWFTPTEIGYEKYVHKSDRTISDQGLSKSSAKLLPAGTIVLTTRASIGDVSIMNCKGCTNQGCQSLVTNAHFDNEFLYYKLLTLKNVMMQYASGSTFFELSPSKLKEILTSIPEYQEQKRIAEVLSEIDRDLKVMNERRDKLNLLKQAMMQELLTGRIRLT